MSMDPGAMQQLLSQQLQQPAPTAGGGMAGPQMQGNMATPIGIGGQIAQKIMLMKALQQGQAQQPQINQAIQQMNPMAPPNPTPGAQNA